MKNLLSNIPGLRPWLNWFKSISYRLKSQRLKLGYDVQLNAVKFESDVSVGPGCNLLRVELGKFTYLAGDCFFRDVKIGRFCAIASGVRMGLGFHPLEMVSIHPAFYSTELQTKKNFAKKNSFEDHLPGEIGNDVWIGANAVILDGVKIGDGSVIAAGSVVNRDVEPYEVVGGVPIKHIRYRFSDQIVSELSSIKWWNWDNQKIQDNSELFTEIEKFSKVHRNGGKDEKI